MGILGKMNTVIKSNINDLLDKMSDPAKEIDLLVSDMEDDLKKGRQEVVSAAATVKGSQRRCEELKAAIQTWQERAEKAVVAGDDALAREALHEKLAKQAELEASQKLLSEDEAYAAELMQSLKELESRLKEIRLRKESLKERARAMKDERTGLKAQAFDEFDRLENRIEASEELANLTETMDDREAATEAKFARLETKNPEIEDELAKLKRKLDSDKKE